MEARSTMRRAAVAILGLASIFAGAAPVAKIDGPTTRKDGQSIVLSAEASVSDSPLEWQLISPPGLPLFVSDKSPRKAIYAALLDPEPGEYLFFLVAKGKVGEGYEVAFAIHRVVVGGIPQPVPPTPGPTPGPTPSPGPSPNPSPTPGPIPVSEVIHASLVFDVQAADPKLAAILSSAAIRTAASRLNIILRAYDDQAQAVVRAGLMPSVNAAGGPPAIVFQAADGTVLATVPCPPTAEGVIALFGRMRPAGAGVMMPGPSARPAPEPRLPHAVASPQGYAP